MSLSVAAITAALKEVYNLSERDGAKLRLIRRYWDKASYRLRSEARAIEKKAKGYNPDSPISRMITGQSPLLALIGNTRDKF